MELIKNIMISLFISIVGNIIAGLFLLFFEYKKLRNHDNNRAIKNTLIKSKIKYSFKKVKNIIFLSFIIIFIGLTTFRWIIDKEAEPKIEISKTIQELATITDVNILLSNLNEYYIRGILVIGQRNDFVPPDGCYVFIVDENLIYSVYLFYNNSFFDIRTHQNLNQLPDSLMQKQQIWVLESCKLIKR